MKIPIKRIHNQTVGTRQVMNRQPQAYVERLSALENATVRQMYNLYGRYYEATSMLLFESDLSDKDFAVVLRDKAGAVIGFSTLAILNLEIDGRSLRAIYSGDTIIDRAH